MKRDAERQAKLEKRAQEREKEFEKRAQEREKWKLLTSRCTSLRERIPSLPPGVREDMAFFLGEAGADLRAINANFTNPNLAGVTSRVNPNFVEQMLDDARWFLDRIEKCILTAKGEQTCQLDEEALKILKGTPESSKAAYLREMPTFCPE